MIILCQQIVPGVKRLQRSVVRLHRSEQVVCTWSESWTLNPLLWFNCGQDTRVISTTDTGDDEADDVGTAMLPLPQRWCCRTPTAPLQRWVFLPIPLVRCHQLLIAAVVKKRMQKSVHSPRYLCAQILNCFYCFLFDGWWWSPLHVPVVVKLS